jgi:hypothetical protein
LASFLDVLLMFGDLEQRTAAQIDEVRRSHWKRGLTGVWKAAKINPGAPKRAKMFVAFSNLMRLYTSAFDRRAPVPAHLGDDTDFT